MGLGCRVLLMSVLHYIVDVKWDHDLQKYPNGL